MNKTYIGNGTVELIAGGGRIYTDVAARFVRSEKSLLEIINAPYSKELVNKILEYGHNAALEFDYFIFGVEGYSRVTEVQLVRKRLASYMIKSGRTEKEGKRSFDIVMPKGLDFSFKMPYGKTVIEVNADFILDLIEMWYDEGVELGYHEEDLRYLKPQATEFKAIIGMNAHALRDWFKVRCCLNASAEIRDMANKMATICKQVAPDLFEGAGANCVELGYCPENENQNEACKGQIWTKNGVKRLIEAQIPGMVY